MKKILSISLLALGAAYAMPAAANAEQGGHLYIQNPGADVLITYVPGSSNSWEGSRSAHTNYLWIGALDSEGALIGGVFTPLLKSSGKSTDVAALGSCSTCLMQGGSNVYSYAPPVGAVELVFSLKNENTNMTYLSGAAGGKPYDGSGFLMDLVTYAPGYVTVGFEDGGGTPKKSGHTTDWDWNDVVIKMTNVGNNPPPRIPPPSIPEPETYAMMLAGLGLVGAVARRRRSVGRS
ncbi:MAG: PEPxxWA-CTERM sorting domain-containing protein [Betaproteobacteria bacterium]|nr:PEPxxWA-CTERM sorting domain-containing protein [Betaproteobacteria bacterium]